MAGIAPPYLRSYTDHSTHLSLLLNRRMVLNTVQHYLAYYEFSYTPSNKDRYTLIEQSVPVLNAEGSDFVTIVKTI